MTTIIVLGMHRSGTSCVTQALHEGGAWLGEGLMNETATDNLEGHWESWKAVEINEEILKASGATWHEIPSPLELRSTSEIDASLKDFLTQLAAQPIAGFKDPRTLLTLPLWRPHLQNPRYVACLRHPYNVARSLFKRFAHWKWEKGLHLWYEYNSRLLRYAEETSPDALHWFDFDAEPQTVEASLGQMLSWLGLKAAPDRFNQFLRHNEELPPITEPHIAELYQSLRQRAAEHQAMWCSGVLTCDGSPESDAADARRQLRQLRTLHKRYDELIQRQQAMLWWLDAHMRKTLVHCEQLHGQWQELREKQQAGQADRERLSLRCDDAQRRADDMDAVLQATRNEIVRQAEARRVEREALEAELEHASQALEHQFQHQLHEQHALLGAVVHSLHERTSVLEQRLFWPLLVRRTRRVLGKIKRNLLLQPAA